MSHFKKYIDMKPKIYIAILLGIFMVFSCEDFLDEELFSQMTPDVLFSTPENAQLSVNGVYSKMFGVQDLFRIYLWKVGLKR